MNGEHTQETPASGAGWKDRLGTGRPAGAFAWYLVLTLAYTWPLPLSLATDIASDLGDPLLNAWIIAWNGERLLDLLSGDLAGFARMWHANILHPQPYVLAFSELMHAQGVQALPIWALTRNPVLCYNLLLLSTFALSGLGMYLFVRDLTGDSRAAFVAGLFFAFMPYRADQLPHLQTLSSQWMGFALFGLRRYFVTRRIRPLAWAGVALVAQYLSCGYYLFMFSIVVPPYVIWEMWTRSLLGDMRVWLDLAVAAVVVGALTVPTMYPYLALRELRGLSRSADELRHFSADALGFLTAGELVAAWHWLQLAPKAEGKVFMGVAAPLLAAIGVGCGLRAALHGDARPANTSHTVAGWMWRAAVVLAVLVALVSALAVMAYVALGPIDWRTSGFRLRIRSPIRAGVLLAAALIFLQWRAPRLLSGLPARLVAVFRSPAVIFGLLTLVTAWLALGPILVVGGVPRASGTLYAWLYQYLPGFDSRI